MDNKSIKTILSQYVSLLELHDENPFKVRALSSKVFNIDRVNTQFSQLSKEELIENETLGKKMGSWVASILESGTFQEYQELLGKTPAGVVEMLGIKGIGAKKVRVLWQDLGLETKRDLKLACEDGIISGLKGFGEKTQQKILKSLEFEEEQSGKGLFAEWEPLALEIETSILNQIEGLVYSRAGDLALKEDVLSSLEWTLGTDNKASLTKTLEESPLISYSKKESGPGNWKGTGLGGETIKFRIHSKKDFSGLSIYYASYPGFLDFNSVKTGEVVNSALHTFQGSKPDLFFEHLGLPAIPPYLRDERILKADNPKGYLASLIEEDDIKGIIHAHSTFSDGRQSLEEISAAVKNKGYQYFGITDHSKSAFYANGLDEERIFQQHSEIDDLNSKNGDFHIFKGIESDILNDGSLDYPEEILESFDFIIASIHSNLDMDIRKATARLINAVENPYCTMLGHMTGRLLLRRKGYPVDHKMVIDACAANNVIIEINANPWRLDIDWHQLGYALEKDVMISINPDAHDIKGIDDVRFGVVTGRKGGLTKAMTFNAKTKEEVSAWFEKKRGATR